jgi:hypothetical protein
VLWIEKRIAPDRDPRIGLGDLAELHSERTGSLSIGASNALATQSAVMSPWVDPIPPVVKVAHGAHELAAPPRRNGASPRLHDFDLLRRQRSCHRQEAVIIF